MGKSLLFLSSLLVLSCTANDTGEVQVLSMSESDADLTRLHQAVLDDGEDEHLILSLNTSHFENWETGDDVTVVIPDDTEVPRVSVIVARCPGDCIDSALWTRLGEATGSVTVRDGRSSFADINLAFAEAEAAPKTELSLVLLDFSRE